MPESTFIRRRLVEPILAQLKQGITPEKIALTIAVGVAISIFPVLGVTTTLCLIAGLVLRLNQPLLQLVNYAAYPLQLLLIPVFIRCGERFFGVPSIPFSPALLAERFNAGPMQFLREFGVTLFHAGVAWLLVTPLLAFAASRALRPVMKAMAEKSAPEVVNSPDCGE